MNRFLIMVFAFIFANPVFAASGDTVNFRFSPLGLIVGSLNASLDFQIDKQWTVGPTGSFWRFQLNSGDNFSEDYDLTAYGFGGRANWYKNGVHTDGLYVGPSIQYTNVKLTTKDTLGASVEGTASGLFLSGLIGYGWFWESFNILLGGGLNVGLGDTKVSVKDSSGARTEVASNLAGLALEFSFGWTF